MYNSAMMSGTVTSSGIWRIISITASLVDMLVSLLCNKAIVRHYTAEASQSLVPAVALSGWCRSSLLRRGGSCCLSRLLTLLLLQTQFLQSRQALLGRFVRHRLRRRRRWLRDCRLVRLRRQRHVDAQL